MFILTASLSRLPRFGRFRAPDIEGLVRRLMAAKQCSRAVRRGRRPNPVALRILGIDERSVGHLRLRTVPAVRRRRING